MCQAFSCLVSIDKKVTWKFGIDSHSELVRMAGYKDNTSNAQETTFARAEITPDNKSYLKPPDNWLLRVDESITPVWFGEKHKELAFTAHKKWLVKLDRILIRKEIVRPFDIPAPKITDKHIAWLKVGKSVWESVWESVRAYIGSFFNLPKWKYIDHPKGKYPFKSLVQLWEAGLVPSFDGTTWRLHGGKKAAVLFEITAEELRKR